MRKFKILLILSALFSPLALAHELPEITKKWQSLIEQYKIHMVVGEWNGAIQAAETLINEKNIDTHL